MSGELCISQVDQATAGGNRTNTTHLRERGFRADPRAIVAGGDEHLRGDVEPLPDSIDELRRRGPGLHLKMSAVDLDLLVQIEPASRERSEDVPHAASGPVKEAADES
ncbi:hypothetical protein [Agromyces italicus]|uniref:hypothetical protein n=1 Tax=Agromyces italicus TaxID=279572 RepID=UPI0012FA5CE3|nr:hypothetical protein [Agromyces italicus]